MKLFAVLSRPVKEKLLSADHSELQSSAFWVGHILMVAATIAGVYLAAQAGLQQAILFDDITSKQSNFYLRQSLYEEVSSNVTILRDYNSEYFSRSISAQELKQNNPKLSRYVWDTMKYSPFTLETPSYFLMEVQSFYRQVDDLIEKGEKRTYGASYAGKMLTELLDHMEKDVLPALKNNSDSLAQELKAVGVDVVLTRKAES